jgi:hypothetical protein
MTDRWTQRIADRLRWAGGGMTAAAPTDPDLPATPSVATAEAVSAVFTCADPAEFVRKAYRLVLARDPSPGELARRVTRLKYLPFYTRTLMLRRLTGSVEAQLVLRAEQQRQAAALGHLRRVCEQAARTREAA